MRRNGFGPLAFSVGSGVPMRDAVFVVGSVEIRGAPEDWTAGSPTIVFLRGGLEEAGVPWDESRFRTVGGGVT